MVDLKEYNRRLKYVLAKINDFVRVNYSQINGVNFNTIRELDINLQNYILSEYKINTIIEEEKNIINKKNNLSKENIENNKISNELIKKITYLRIALSKFKEDKSIDKDLIKIIEDVFIQIDEQLDSDNVLYESLYFSCDLNQLIRETEELLKKEKIEKENISEKNVKDRYINYLDKVYYNNKELYRRLRYVYDELDTENGYKKFMNFICFRRGLDSYYYLANRDSTITNMKKDTEFINELVVQTNDNINKEIETLHDETKKDKLEVLLCRLILHRRLNCASTNYSPGLRKQATDTIKLITNVEFADKSKIKEEEFKISDILYMANDITEELNKIFTKKNKSKNNFINKLKEELINIFK